MPGNPHACGAPAGQRSMPGEASGLRPRAPGAAGRPFRGLLPFMARGSSTRGTGALPRAPAGRRQRPDPAPGFVRPGQPQKKGIRQSFHSCGPHARSSRKPPRAAGSRERRDANRGALSAGSRPAPRREEGRAAPGKRWNPVRPACAGGSDQPWKQDFSQSRQTCMRRGKRKPMAPVGQLVRQLAQCQHSSPCATSGRSLPFCRCRSSST